MHRCFSTRSSSSALSVVLITVFTRLSNRMDVIVFVMKATLVIPALWPEPGTVFTVETCQTGVTASIMVVVTTILYIAMMERV